MQAVLAKADPAVRLDEAGLRPEDVVILQAAVAPEISTEIDRLKISLDA